MISKNRNRYLLIDGSEIKSIPKKPRWKMNGSKGKHRMMVRKAFNYFGDCLGFVEKLRGDFELIIKLLKSVPTIKNRQADWKVSEFPATPKLFDSIQTKTKQNNSFAHKIRAFSARKEIFVGGQFSASGRAFSVERKLIRKVKVRAGEVLAEEVRETLRDRNTLLDIALGPRGWLWKSCEVRWQKLWADSLIYQL